MHEDISGLVHYYDSQGTGKRDNVSVSKLEIVAYIEALYVLTELYFVILPSGVMR